MVTVETPTLVGVAVTVAFTPVKSIVVAPAPIIVPPDETPTEATRPVARPVILEPSP